MRCAGRMKCEIRVNDILRGSRARDRRLLVVESILPNGDLRIKGTLGPEWTLSEEDSQYYDHFPTGGNRGEASFGEDS